MTEQEITKLLDDAQRVEDIKSRIHDQFPETPWPNVYLDALWVGNGAETMIESHSGVVVELAGKKSVCNFVTDQYKLVPHEVVLHYLMDEVKVNWAPKWGKPTFEVNLYDNGAKAKMSARFPEMTMDKKAMRVGKDVVEPWIGFKNSYDSQWVFSGAGGGKVLRCSNGMMGTKTLMHFRKKHRKDLFMEDMVQRLSTAMETIEQEHEMWKTWAKLQIAKAQAEEILEALPISEKQTEKIMQLEEIGTGQSLEGILKTGSVSAWTMNSILTQWLTHEVKESSGRHEREEEFAFVLARNFEHLRK
jgi:hypothetical protein